MGGRALGMCALPPDAWSVGRQCQLDLQASAHTASIRALSDRAAALWPLAGLSLVAGTALPPPLAFSWISVLAQPPVHAGINRFQSSRFFFFKQSLHLAQLHVAVQTPLLRRATQPVFYSFLEKLPGFAGRSCTQVPGESRLTCSFLRKQLSKVGNPTSLPPPSLGARPPASSSRLPLELSSLASDFSRRCGTSKRPVQTSWAEVLLQVPLVSC